MSSSKPNLKSRHRILSLTHVDTEEYLQKEDHVSTAQMISILKKFNPYPEGSFQSQLYLEQSLINVPLLYFASIYLYMYANQRGIKHFLFTQRDCIHWHRIFKLLFPETSVTYFACSRNMFTQAQAQNNQHYLEYIKKSIAPYRLDQTMYVDIYGSGRHAYEYFSTLQGEPHPHIFLLSNRWTTTESLPAFTHDLMARGLYHVVCPGNLSGSIEMLNYDLKGSIANYRKETGFARLPLEYDTKYVLVYHQVVDRFLNLLKTLNLRLDETMKEMDPDDFPLDTYREKIIHFIRFLQDRPAIALKIPLVKRHPFL